MTTFMTYKEECESLRKQLAEKYAEIAFQKNAHEQSQQLLLELGQELAASQAREVQLREALDNHSGNYKLSKDECKRINALLDTTSDTTALEAMIAKAGEVMKKSSAALCNRFGERMMHPNECASAIRALPRVTLEDIKNG